MGKSSIFFAGLFAILIAGSGCQKSSDNNSGPSGGETGNSQPGNPSNPGFGSPGLVATNLVKEIQFVSGAETLVTQNEAADFESEYIECGVSDSLVPVCKNSAFLVSNFSISMDVPSTSSISGKVSRYKPTGKTLYLFRVDDWTADGKKTSAFDVFVSTDTATNLDTLAQQAAQKISAVPIEERISKLEETLGVKHLAGIIEFTFSNESEFASAYTSQIAPRAYYHWSAIALSKGYESAPVVQFFREHFGEKLAAANLNYKELLVEQGLTASDFWKVSSQVIDVFKAEYSASSEISLRGKLAISILVLVSAKDASSDHLFESKNYLFSTSENIWIRRGVSLFTKYGSTFGTSDELVKFGKSSDWSVRTEVAKALVHYKDDLANQWLLYLNADTDNDVRTAALVTISGRKFDAGNFDVSSLINPSNWSSRAGLAKALKYVTGREGDIALLSLSADTDNDVRVAALSSLQARPCDIGSINLSSLISSSNWGARAGLAKALKYTTGQGANEALLRLSADTDYDVRTAAIEAIKGRPFDAGNFDVSSLINPSNWSSRAGLAKALNYVAGEGANRALVQLNADTDNDVRTAALTSIAGRPFDAGDFNVSAFINPNWSSRSGLAKALKYVKGRGANEALLRLNADTDNDVRTAALASLAARPFDAGNFEVSSLINPSSWSSRAGLARGLKYVTGQKSINALIVLVSDSDPDVRNAAKESLKAHGY